MIQNFTHESYIGITFIKSVIDEVTLDHDIGIVKVIKALGKI
ncbi:hypothetical protein [Winogradskyella ursingii]|nr:hypothetical protein [Winogradskyella ursingii]